MGWKPPPIKRRELIHILTVNGFTEIRHDGSSHRRFRGYINGRECLCDVDDAIDEYSWKSHSALYYIITRQLQISHKAFYAGHPDAGRRFQMKHKLFGDVDQ